MVDFADVVAGGNSGPGTSELLGDDGVVETAEPGETEAMQGVIPVVAVHEEDGTVWHSDLPGYKEEPRRVAEARPRGD